MKYVYLYLPDAMADWEPGHAIAELNSGEFFKNPDERLPVVTVGIDKSPIRTIGGLTIVPDATLEEATVDTAAALLLPGSNSWQDTRQGAAIEKAEEFLRSEVVVAAICGATAALANAGVLDKRPHTSNGLQYLEMFAPNYKGRKFYRQEKAVAADNLVTAGAAGVLMWTRLILDRLGVFAPLTMEAWYKYYDTGDPKYYYAIMDSLSGRQGGSP